MQEFWHVSFPIDADENMRWIACVDERQAHINARSYSRSHGFANITSHNGWMATYQDGRMTFPYNERGGLHD